MSVKISPTEPIEFSIFGTILMVPGIVLSYSYLRLSLEMVLGYFSLICLADNIIKNEILNELFKYIIRNFQDFQYKRHIKSSRKSIINFNKYTFHYNNFLNPKIKKLGGGEMLRKEGG